jgi:hypothetical protein
MHRLRRAWRGYESIARVAPRQLVFHSGQLPCLDRIFLPHPAFVESVLMALGAQLLPRGAQLLGELLDRLAIRALAAGAAELKR